MKRSIFVQEYYLPECAERQQRSADRLFHQISHAAGVNGCEKLYAAARDLPDRRKVFRLRNLIDRYPLRIHAAQQHQHSLAFRTVGKHVRTWTKVKLRHTTYRTCKLQPLVHDRDPLSRSGKRPNTAPQERCLPVSRRTCKQTRIPQIRQQAFGRMENLMRNADRH